MGRNDISWIRLTKGDALQRFRSNKEVYRLYHDGLEGLIQNEEGILDDKFSDYDFGVEPVGALNSSIVYFIYSERTEISTIVYDTEMIDEPLGGLIGRADKINRQLGIDVSRLYAERIVNPTEVNWSDVVFNGLVDED